ncbi:MAG: hypothetical protein ACTSQG_09975, partial [Promethearchaeota archaeon]
MTGVTCHCEESPRNRRGGDDVAISITSYIILFKTLYIVIIIDACNAGSFDNQINEGILLMACQSDEEIDEPDILQNGLFTYYIVEGMKGWADPDDTYISTDELFAYADQKVNYYNKWIWWEQNPEDDVDVSHFNLIDRGTFTTSGTISSSETWHFPVQLTGNITINSGVTLTMESDAAVILNGYQITNYGTIADNDKIWIPGKIKLPEGNVYYGSVSNAFNAGNTVEIIKYYGDSFTIPSGKTLNINAGTTVKMEDDEQITIYGTLNIDG